MGDNEYSNEINMEEGDEDDYCTDSVETLDIPAEKKRSSVDEQITKLTADILQQKTIKLDHTLFDEKMNFQDKIDTILNQMRDAAHFMNVKCEMIEKMNILMCILTFKIFDIQHSFNLKLDSLKDQRENILLLKKDEDMVPIELMDLDRIMRELQYRHRKTSTGYKQQKIDMQLEYEKLITILDQQLDFLKDGLEILREEHRKFLMDTKRAEPLLVDYIIQSALEEFTEVIENFEVKKSKGWKSLFGDEEILDQLQSRGLAVSKSGYILTEGGERLSYDEADRRQLLTGLEFRDRITSPPDVLVNDDIVSLPSQTTEESSKESLETEISSGEVSYLKETLGKPLTLAIAEITSKQPKDPIHYLGHWLFKYRHNQELDVQQKQEYDALVAERNRLLKEKLRRMYEEEARLLLYEMANNAENQVIRKELQRILREQAMAEDENDQDQAYKEYEELKKLLILLGKPIEDL